MMTIEHCITQCEEQERASLDPEFIEFMHDVAVHLKVLQQATNVCDHEWEAWEVKEDPICKKCGKCVSDLK
jgi:hypothetical protein